MIGVSVTGATLPDKILQATRRRMRLRTIKRDRDLWEETA